MIYDCDVCHNKIYKICLLIANIIKHDESIVAVAMINSATRDTKIVAMTTIYSILSARRAHHV